MYDSKLRIQTAKSSSNEVDWQRLDISSNHNTQIFCKQLIAQVNIATCERIHVDNGYRDRKQGEAVIGSTTSDQYFKVDFKLVSRIFDTGIQTAKDTLAASTQDRIRTA